MENNTTQTEIIEYTTNIEQDGKTYFQSLAHQLADYVCSREYDDFKFTAEKGFTSAKIFIEKAQAAGLFSFEKSNGKKCIGVILFDVENNRMILRKTGVNREIHEFHADGKLDDCFGVQYEIFKYLRDGDIIQVHSSEIEGRKKVPYVYRITKIKALRNGRFLHFKGHGTQFFIPVADFKREVERRSTQSTTKEKKWTKKNAT